MAPIAISVECCVPICDFHQFFWLALLILAIVFPGERARYCRSQVLQEGAAQYLHRKGKLN
eukprot:scaffold173082_cov18-Tisochrysis_lutea.AAC.1